MSDVLYNGVVPKQTLIKSKWDFHNIQVEITTTLSDRNNLQSQIDAKNLQLKERLRYFRELAEFLQNCSDNDETNWSENWATFIVQNNLENEENE